MFTFCFPGTYICECSDYLSGQHCNHVKAVTLLGSAYLALDPITSLQQTEGRTSDTLVIQFSFSTLDVFESQLILYAVVSSRNTYCPSKRNVLSPLIFKPDFDNVHICYMCYIIFLQNCKSFNKGILSFYDAKKVW